MIYLFFCCLLLVAFVVVVLRLSLPFLFGNLRLHVLGETASTNEVTADGVEHAVDIAAALSGGIELGKLNILID